MDRPIEQTNWPPRRIVIASGIGLAVVVLAWIAIGRAGKSSVDVEGEKLSVSQVTRGEFQEYVPITGAVQPNTTVFLDLEEGGIVEKIYVQGGSPIKKGELILSFSNSSAQKQNIEAETRLIDNLNQLRNSKINLTQSNLLLKDQLLDLEYRIGELEKTVARFQELMKSPNTQLSKEQFEAKRDELVYLKNKRELLQQRIARETDLQEQQSIQIDSSIKRVNKNLEILTRIVDALEVRAPIDGHLSSLSAEIGQSFQRGQRIGQIDQLQSFKVRANIDQFYISKVSEGQKGKFQFAGRDYELTVSKIFPEVTQDSFQVDLAFVGPVPEGVKRGQTLQIDLGLSEAKTTNMVAKGSFYRHTNGRWAYLVAEDGFSARRTALVLGRQNPQYVEVLEGLKPGDRIITSSYDKFNDVDELNFPERLQQ